MAKSLWIQMNNFPSQGSPSHFYGKISVDLKEQLLPLGGVPPRIPERTRQEFCTRLREADGKLRAKRGLLGNRLTPPLWLKFVQKAKHGLHVSGLHLMFGNVDAPKMSLLRHEGGCSLAQWRWLLHGSLIGNAHQRAEGCSAAAFSAPLEAHCERSAARFDGHVE